ncbi:MAG: adenylosuccinate synthase [Kiritimatiellaeota bacterium]|nr:adenylosuccinate synthase [Kiritimatiellota bacterium]
MPNTVLIGLQWGDEGKGKVIDVLTESAEVVVRFQGGNNAGHTVEVGEERFVLHLVPSGIIREQALCIIGNGVVVNPLALFDEIRELRRRGLNVDGRLQISSRCQLVFQYHCLLDGLLEQKLAENKIGTTKRGIGPAYADKVNRVGIRAADLCRLDRLEVRFRRQASFYNRILRDAAAPELDVDAEWKKLAAVAHELAPLVQDTVLTLNRAFEEGREVLFEGAQGTWLDVDFGTYPYVTSSNTTAGGACTGAGAPPARIDRVVGVAKAYTTRVGRGPFPTELRNDLGERLRREGREFGATTGRPRRCGWFDAVATRYAVMLNGADTLAVTKLDVLDGLDVIKICTAYEIGGELIDRVPTEADDLERVVPQYEEVPGWKQSTAQAADWDELPAEAQAYLRRLEELVRAPIGLVSVGPRRSQTFAVS